MHVLIVDDEAEVARVLAESVSSEGHTVTVAYRGEQALAVLDHVRPDVVFLDAVMPEMSGMEVLRQIRRRDAELPVMLISGRADAEILEEARRLGVTDIIGKPSGLRYPATRPSPRASPGTRPRHRRPGRGPGRAGGPQPGSAPPPRSGC
ncbi:MAG: two-component system response regulator [Candidatus Rokuibacteriota bacterium]|nr:MAG: two-component system response regulator [Candidatus Rokubacteria bacterium]